MGQEAVVGVRPDPSGEVGGIRVLLAQHAGEGNDGRLGADLEARQAGLGQGEEPDPGDPVRRGLACAPPPPTDPRRATSPAPATATRRRRGRSPDPPGACSPGARTREALRFSVTRSPGSQVPTSLMRASIGRAGIANRYPSRVDAHASPGDDWFANRLLAWFDEHGRRALPWQLEKTPYRVWVSEVMLQQTQVTTVVPYFERFVRRFPDVRSLAGAELDEVLHLWTGLGYYGPGAQPARRLSPDRRRGHPPRARFRFPDTLEALTALPGIGPLHRRRHSSPSPSARPSRSWTPTSGACCAASMASRGRPARAPSRAHSWSRAEEHTSTEPPRRLHPSDHGLRRHALPGDGSGLRRLPRPRAMRRVRGRHAGPVAHARAAQGPPRPRRPRFPAHRSRRRVPPRAAGRLRVWGGAMVTRGTALHQGRARVRPRVGDRRRAQCRSATPSAIPSPTSISTSRRTISGSGGGRRRRRTSVSPGTDPATGQEIGLSGVARRLLAGLDLDLDLAHPSSATTPKESK